MGNRRHHKKYEKRCPKCGKELVKDVSKIKINGYGDEIGPTMHIQPRTELMRRHTEAETDS